MSLLSELHSTAWQYIYGIDRRIQLSDEKGQNRNNFVLKVDGRWQLFSFKERLLYCMAHVSPSTALKAPSFSGRKIEDLTRCETGVYRRRIRNASEKLRAEGAHILNPKPQVSSSARCVAAFRIAKVALKVAVIIAWKEPSNSVSKTLYRDFL